jgi:hypothetical protein
MMTLEVTEDGWLVECVECGRSLWVTPERMVVRFPGDPYALHSWASHPGLTFQGVVGPEVRGG